MYIPYILNCAESINITRDSHIWQTIKLFISLSAQEYYDYVVTLQYDCNKGFISCKQVLLVFQLRSTPLVLNSDTKWRQSSKVYYEFI